MDGENGILGAFSLNVRSPMFFIPVNYIQKQNDLSNLYEVQP